MKKIVHLFPAYKIGGAPICVLRSINYTNKDYKHFVIAKKVDSNLYNQFRDVSEEVIDCDVSSISIKSISRIFSCVYRIKPDIIHCHGKGGAFYGLFLSLFRFIGYKFDIFYTFHGFHQKFNGIKAKLYLLFEYLFSLIYKNSIAVSESERKFVLQLTKIKSEKIVTIPNGVKLLSRHTPDYIQKTLDRFKVNIVTLSRISVPKDLVTMINSFDNIDDKTVSLHIMGGFLGGDKEYKLEVDKCYENCKSKDRIFFWGDIENASGLLKNFDIYLSTSIFEGLPTAIIEAFQSELFVVGTNCRGNIDLIKHMRTGILCEKKNVIDITRGIVKAISILGTDECSTIIQNAYSFGFEFSVENNVKKITNLYG